MLKQAITLAGLTISLSANAVIMDLGYITRDTATGLDWLDVTETRGLSYNNVVSEMGVDGAYEGWRYATEGELATVIINFGYTPLNYNPSSLDCIICDFYGNDGPTLPDDPYIENIIRTLGDTNDAHYDSTCVQANSGCADIHSDGAGRLTGIIAKSDVPGSHYHAQITDDEDILRGTNKWLGDDHDGVHTTRWEAMDDITSDVYVGSFLVRAVPVPAAAWLFGSGLVGLAGMKRKK